MQIEDGAVLPHHKDAARLWGLGGEAYNRISFGISDALAHAAQRLNAKPGEKILDVATGTGWTARNIAATGAFVTGVDIAEELLTAAGNLSAHLHPAIEFQLADAERLPFGDKAFDRVISTFGVMFAVNQQAAAQELARVCRPGGRLVLATWAPAGSVASFFRLIAEFGNARPAGPSPLAWGDPEHVQRLLGESFELTFESGINNACYDNADEVWHCFAEGFGPVQQVIRSADKTGLNAFHEALNAYHNRFLTGDGLLCIRREYLIVIGQRK